MKKGLEKHGYHQIQRTVRWIAAVLALAVSGLSGSVLAQTVAKDSYEVSYLVFHKDAGFDSPQFKADALDGTISIEFEEMPHNWRRLLKKQINTENKRRFFASLEPMESNGEVIGIQAHLGIGAFTIRTYVKADPARWVLNVATTIVPPLNKGLAIMPVVPYADLIEDNVAGHDDLAEAELALANGDLETACPVFARLQRYKDPVRSWATLRASDCLIRNGRFAEAAHTLEPLIRSSNLKGAVHLALLRVEEVSGRTLSRDFRPSLYRIKSGDTEIVGTVADEISYREARAWLLRGESQRAMVAIHNLLDRRPYSPFFVDRSFLQTVRWRALRTLRHHDRWLDVSQAYLKIPPGVTNVPHWADIHMVGADALRRIGLPRRAIEVYQYLLKHPDLIYEADVILSLAETYWEAGDIFRADVTVKYLLDEYPEWQERRRTLVIAGQVALNRDNYRTAGDMLVRLQEIERDEWTPSEIHFGIATSMRALRLEGLPAARNLVPAAGHSLADDVRLDLAMAAGDCDTMKKATNPIELASGETLLWTGACLVHEGRMEEASVLFEAIRLYTPSVMANLTLEPLMRLTKESANWWLKNQSRLPKNPADKESTL
jgi:tetratricopeptide (TPR) repeat protein